MNSDSELKKLLNFLYYSLRNFKKYFFNEFILIKKLQLIYS